MKHSIGLKFVAVLLAVLTLTVVLSSTAGIAVLAATGLYDRSVEELYEERMDEVCREYAVNLVHRYASLNLGNIPEGYLDEYYGFSWQYDTFRSGYFCYNIRDQHGNLVENTQVGDLTEAKRYEIVVTDLHYRRLVPDSTVEIAAQTEVYEGQYYDYMADTYVTFRYEIHNLPPYTVELYLLPEAVATEYGWDLLEQLWSCRVMLFYVLAGSLLLFAVVIVYLCWAAGKGSGSTEIRPGGLNRLPLDLYGLAAGGLLGLLVWLGMEGGEYLIRQESVMTVPFILAEMFIFSLLLVGFVFAVAAQSKTPEGFWWRNTILARVDALLRKGIPALWRGGKKIVYIVVITGFKKLDAGLTWLGHWVGRQLRKVFWMLHRFLSLMPLMWQWLAAGFLMICVLMLCMYSGEPEMLLVGFAAAMALVLYGSHCFGVLLGGAKRMGKGDLETKVDGNTMLGSFREFAGDLNALADVAMVAAQKQLKSERMKTELITNVSHDIKTPLTSIINYVDLLEKTHTEEEQTQYLEVLSRQSQRLKKLVDDLMEMSKASTGNMAADIIPVDAGEAVQQALGEFSEKFEKISLTPVLHLPEEPVTVLADGRLLWRVLSNLLSNAYKYALPGTRLYIDLLKAEDKAVISLKNISREPLNVSAEELMERFVRGDASRNTEGSGLGLNIAQSLMQIQRGQLELLVDGDLFKVTLTFPAV